MENQNSHWWKNNSGGNECYQNYGSQMSEADYSETPNHWIWLLDRWEDISLLSVSETLKEFHSETQSCSKITI